MSSPPSSLVHAPGDLEVRLRRVDPAVRLVPARHARRVARALTPADQSSAFHPAFPVRVDLAQLVDRRIVRPTVFDGDGTDRLLLVEPDDLVHGSDLTDAELLRVYWRLMFRARVLAALDDLTDAVAEDRLDTMGVLAENEIRFVLQSDHTVSRPATRADIYRAFAAETADRYAFAPQTVRVMFPSLPPRNTVSRLIGDDVDVAELLRASRPEGAADPDPGPAEDESDDAVAELPLDIPFEEETEPSRLLRRAQRAAELGNHVRAAVLRTRAAKRLTGKAKQRGTAAAMSAVRDGLVHRLRPILGWDYDQAKRWSHALAPLLGPAARGVWPRAARVLYDLQRVAVDLEQEIDAVEPIEWIRSLGAKPLRRPLTRARPVIRLNHLASAAGHLRRATLDPADRRRIEHLLDAEIARAEQLVRDELGPVFRATFDEVGLRPANVLEEVARDKLVAELLDRVCDRGFLRLGDLRDAIARNQLKIPDLRGPWEFVAGDPLLRADERLGEELHGVYRRGEIYLRWIQRLTALSFGTPAGRWLTRYAAIPFGGAFLAVEFAKYLAHEATKVWGFVAGLAPDQTPLELGRPLVGRGTEAAVAGPVGPPGAMTSADDVAAAEHAIEFTPASVTAMIVLGFVILGLLHSATFRAAVVRTLSAVWTGILVVVRDAPLAVWRSPPVRAVRRSPVIRVVIQYLGPGIFAGTATWLALWLIGTDPMVAVSWGWSAFAVMALVFNSPIGRVVTDAIEEVASDAWRHVWSNLIPGLLGWVTMAFRRLAGMVERVLYAVDERLRFRPGAAGESLVGKAALAAVWFPIAYTVRFAFTLLIEPQINPVKHFPVVTISHKLLLPLIPSAADATGLSNGTVTLIIGGIPGIFGFVVWELKENWRLYAANRPARQPPVPIGHHGESARGLLRPGFHSGTVPKLYQRLRSAVGLGDSTVRHTPTSRWVHELHEIAIAARALVRRDVIPLLRSAHCWQGLTPVDGPVDVGVQQLTVRLRVEELAGPDLAIAFEHQDGRVLARVVDVGWTDFLTPAQVETLAVAVSGLVEKANATWPTDGRNPLVRSSQGDGPRDWSDRVAFWESARRPDATGT